MMKKHRRCGFYERVAFTIALLCSMNACFASPQESLAIEPCSRTNVIVILTDDQGWGDIGYNNPRVYSPNLDKLAAEGVTLTRNYVMPQCTPTRVALMTGRYPSRFGGPALSASNAPSFPKTTPTLSAMFKACGYRTILCGKWHLGSSPQHGPNHFGFDHSYGSFTGAVGMYDHRYRKGKFEQAWHRNHKPIDGNENGTHATDLVVDEAIRLIEVDQDKPFFLYLPLHSVHTPLDLRGEFVDSPTQLDPANKDRWLNEDKISWFNDPAGLIQQETDPEKRLLLACVNHMDDAIGKLIASLEKTGRRENTLVIFSSDNGPQVSWSGNAYPDDLKLTNFNQPIPMRGKKVDVWEGGIHVPGFVSWPAQLTPAKFDSPVHVIDWVASLAAMLDYEFEADLDGVDVLKNILDGQPLPPRELYWTWSSAINRWALRFGDWKIVKYGKGVPGLEDWQLFNLKSDPKETANVAGTEPEKLQEMHERFLQQRKKDKVAVKKKPKQ